VAGRPAAGIAAQLLEAKANLQREPGQRPHPPAVDLFQRPVPRHRQRMIGLTVDQDYELIDESADPDPVTFDARRVWLPRARRVGAAP
jgi:hypothetical protein